MNKRLIAGMALFVAAVSPAVATGQTPAPRPATPPPPAPPAGSPAIYIPAAELQQVLERAVAAGAEPATSPITVTDQYRGSMVRRTAPNGAITHAGNTEMHYLIEGSGTVVTGGRIVRRDVHLQPSRAESRATSPRGTSSSFPPARPTCTAGSTSRSPTWNFAFSLRSKPFTITGMASPHRKLEKT